MGQDETVNQRTNIPEAHLRLFFLSMFMVTILKTKTYGYGSRHSLKAFDHCIL